MSSMRQRRDNRSHAAYAQHHQSPIRPPQPVHRNQQQHSQYVEQRSQPFALGAAFAGHQFELPHAKRQKLSLAPVQSVDRRDSVASTPSTATPATADAKKSPAIDKCGPQFGSGAGPKSAAVALTPTKSKRVRTGCLTCRERHLKCDEAVPDCLNCRKSNRECKRGVRLNFIDVQVKGPPHIPPTVEWSVQFQDESRLIASEYQGGLGRYARFGPQSITPPRELDVEAALKQHRPSRTMTVDSPGAFYQNSNRAMQAAASQGLYQYSGARQLPDQATFDDGFLQARKNSDASFLAAPSSSHSVTGLGTLANLQDHFGSPVKEEQPSRTHSSADFTSLAALQERFNDSPGSRSHAYKHSDVSSAASLVPQGVATQSSSHRTSGDGHGSPDGLMTPPGEKSGERDYLNSPEEIQFMQVFVEEVGVWMDSFDKEKHFSRIIPYHALKSPMMLNAFLACGVKHLTLINQAYNDDKALFYYDTATTQLLRSLQNPDRNMLECATTAVVLNVYEIMSEKPTQRMSHIAGARALIKECGWDARTKGIGAACFWLNIGMEVLSCLAFNWPTSWEPEQWGVDMDFLNHPGPSNNSGTMDDDQTGAEDVSDEEVWVHRIFYIVAKIANFRANIPKFQEPSPHDEQVRRQNRYAEWKRLKGMCDKWNSMCPRPMQPFGYMAPSQNSKSNFPNVWLIKRAAVIGRLFYHTAMCLLAQINPITPRDSRENMAAQQHHAHAVCGIVAHTKDRGIASVAIRSLAIASCVLTERREQEEVMHILDRINKESGWRLGKVHAELKKAWGWEKIGLGMPGPPPPGPTPGNMTTAASTTTPTSHAGAQGYGYMQHQVTGPGIVAVSMAAGTVVAAPAPMRPPAVNPLSFADFSHPNRPYKNFWAPANSVGAFSTQHF